MNFLSVVTFFMISRVGFSVKPAVPHCKKCIFFDPVKTRIGSIVISEGRCLKSAIVNHEIVHYDVEGKPIARFDFVESCRKIDGICGPNGDLFISKE